MKSSRLSLPTEERVLTLRALAGVSVGLLDDVRSSDDPAEMLHKLGMSVGIASFVAHTMKGIQVTCPAAMIFDVARQEGRELAEQMAKNFEDNNG